MADDVKDLVSDVQQPEQLDLSPQIMSSDKTMWNDVEVMKQSWKMANVLAKSQIIPQAYREKTGDCLIAMDIGIRLALSAVT